MNTTQNLYLQGLPSNLSEVDKALFRSRMLKAIAELTQANKTDEFQITISKKPTKGDRQSSQNSTSDRQTENELTLEARSQQFQPQAPLHNFQQLVIPDYIREDIVAAVEVIRLQDKLFQQWGLSQIEPFPRTALNFHGAPGTGKTKAAHGIAHLLGCQIITASYAQIESKFLGDAPKNVEALFAAAEQARAVLFIDEADSLLSKRLTGATQGSERAANSLTSQILICLERFKGIVIFATNLVANYDKAFETRVRHIHFPMPDESARTEIWRNHLPQKLPLADEVLVEQLAQVEDVCGRDIKNAVIDAAVRVALEERELVTTQDLLDAIARIKEARIKSTEGQKLTPEEEFKLKQKLIAARKSYQIDGKED